MVGERPMASRGGAAALVPPDLHRCTRQVPGVSLALSNGGRALGSAFSSGAAAARFINCRWCWTASSLGLHWIHAQAANEQGLICRRRLLGGLIWLSAGAQHEEVWLAAPGAIPQARGLAVQLPEHPRLPDSASSGSQVVGPSATAAEVAGICSAPDPFWMAPDDRLVPSGSFPGNPGSARHPSSTGDAPGTEAALICRVRACATSGMDVSGSWTGRAVYGGFCEAWISIHCS